MNHAARTVVILLFFGWLAYTCFKRAVRPPRDKRFLFSSESHVVNKNPLTRALNVFIGLIVLMIGIAAAFGSR